MEVPLNKESLRKKAEKKLKHRPKAELKELTADEAAHIIHELQVHQIELEMQNEDLRRAHAELEDSRSKYSDLYDFAPVGYFTFDRNGLVLEVNLTGAGLLGTERSHLIKKPFSHYITNDCQGLFSQHRRNVLDKNKCQTCEIRIKRKNGTELYAQMESTAVKDRDGNFSQCRTVVTDITKRRRYVEELMESEARFRTVFEQAAVGVAQIISRTGQFVRINKRYCDIVGYSRDEMEKLTFQEITHPDDLQADLNNMDLLIKGKIPEFSMEKRYFHKNGTIVWVNLTVSPMWRPGEKPYYHIAVVEDITARKKAEEDLLKAKDELEIRVNERTAKLKSAVASLTSEMAERKEAEEQLVHQREFINNILESVTHPLFVLDVNNYRIVHMNSAARRSVVPGSMPEDITCHALLHGFSKPCTGKQYPCTIREIKETKKTLMLEHVHHENGAADRTVEVYGYPIFDSSGKISQVIEYILDITERKAVEDELLKAKAEIESWNKELEKRVKEKTEEIEKSHALLIRAEKLSALGEMAAGLAHELNSPLAGIIPMLELHLKRAEKAPRAHREISVMLKACDHMARIVRDFTMFARKSGKGDELLDVRDVIETTLSFSITKIKKSGVRLVRQYADNLPMVRGDRSRLQQVILNMISNACDAMPSGGSLIVKTDQAMNGEQVIMKFTDTGAGIRREYLEAIFDPFFTTKKPGEGTGLGLSVSYGIVKDMGGDISVESSPGKGSRFIISLPAARQLKDQTE